MTNNEIVKSQEVLVEVFNFSQEKTPIRVKMVDNEPWFVATDVCQVLKIANNRNAVARLDDDEKKDGVRIMDTVGRTNYVTMINESGLYAIILQSRKPNAKQFRKWVTGEVLPSIRKKGFMAFTRQRPTIWMRETYHTSVWNTTVAASEPLR